MNIVEFPLFNLEIELERVAFSLFGIDVYWYAILIVLGMVIALLLCKRDSGKYGVKFETILDLSLYVIPISIVSARIYYVEFNLEPYMVDPLKIFDFRSGGLAIYGGIIGAVITIIVFCKKRKINFLDILDYVAPFLPLAQAIGRWGNFINVEAYGTETNLPWRMGIFENGIYKEVHPTFLYESSLNLIGLIILLIFRKNSHLKNGMLLSFYLIWYSLVRFFIESMRTDSLILGNLKMAQVISIVLFIIGVVIFIISYLKCSKYNIGKEE